MAATPSGIWIPSSAEEKYQCNLCGKKFNGNERVAWEKHVARCAEEHHDEIMERQNTERPPGFFKPHDPEWADDIWKHGGIRRTRRPRERPPDK